MTGNNTEHLPKLDHLRFFAAAIVVMFHAELFASSGRPADLFRVGLIDQGHIGVQLFMVISGFLMTVIFAAREFEPVKFYMNRILRIYPLFVLIVTLGYFSTPDPRPTSVGLDYLMALLPISNLYRLNYGPFGGQLWTIAVELQFYLLFPLLLRFRRRYGAAPFFASTIGAAIALRAAQFAVNGTVHTFAYFTLFGSLDLFVGGMIAAEVYLWMKAKDVHVRALWPLGGLCAIVIIVAAAFAHPAFFHVDYHHVTQDGISRSAYWVLWPTVQAAVWGLLLVLYLRSAAMVPGTAALAGFGTWSYSIYVWHVLVIELMKGRFLWLSPYLFGVVVLVVTLAVSWASYWLIERPFLDLRAKYRPASSAPLS